MLKKIIPPDEWLVPVTVLVGLIVGMGFYVIHLSKAEAYLSDDPVACINCHVMTTEYVTWNHSAHRNVATCNDCHVPHDNVFNKYYFKAKDGLYHASVYTLRIEPQAITMRQPSKEVVQNNCVRCHMGQVTDVKMTAWVESHQESRTSRLCWECHRDTPHGRVKSLSSVGHQVEPLPVNQQQKEFIPQWIKDQLKK
ncbi:cytochrome c nitrite reductase small subunit [Reichenbachiella carrageenanivorans]|uniref:Cytochrome c nitrite reductase small subunit n=1 Tax=Reichenbachiella carrageenanivorans TaxID=2979869 RepID=A0ABY6CWM7_9BACT|nr:cytochrome c nitrite reductase small subunit [Reichenbachiella carrageenanivorans]UXX78321.1 cytochrome c nitrite reductase small subunit [Reichenbachiella carrageenanivorans]